MTRMLTIIIHNHTSRCTIHVAGILGVLGKFGNIFERGFHNVYAPTLSFFTTYMKSCQQFLLSYGHRRAFAALGGEERPGNLNSQSFMVIEAAEVFHVRRHCLFPNHVHSFPRCGLIKAVVYPKGRPEPGEGKSFGLL